MIAEATAGVRINDVGEPRVYFMSGSTPGPQDVNVCAKSAAASLVRSREARA